MNDSAMRIGTDRPCSSQAPVNGEPKRRMVRDRRLDLLALSKPNFDMNIGKGTLLQFIYTRCGAQYFSS